eukprot:2888675-Rhodomonas_salina.1
MRVMSAMGETRARRSSKRGKRSEISARKGMRSLSDSTLVNVAMAETGTVQRTQSMAVKAPARM